MGGCFGESRQKSNPDGLRELLVEQCRQDESGGARSGQRVYGGNFKLIGIISLRPN